MLQSLKVSESGMIGQQRKLEILANNLANATTPGFRRLLTTFEAIAPAAKSPVPRQVTPGEPGSLSRIPPGSLLEMTTALDLRPGNVEATGNPLDLAVQGDGFFVVRTPAGERYTRNGSFTLDPQGRLVTRGGAPVLGEGGPIQVPEGSRLGVASDGTVSANGQELARIRIVVPANRRALVQEGATLLRSAPGADPPTQLPPEQVRVLAGFLEGSNANPISELVNMITAQRIFEAGQRVLRSADESLSKSVNELPRVR